MTNQVVQTFTGQGGQSIYLKANQAIQKHQNDAEVITQ
jgi:hypothetical protein